MEMNRFKSIMLENHTKGKANLHGLYTDRQIYRSSVSSSQQEIEEEKLYHYRNLDFQFIGTDYRTPEKLVLFVYVPEQMLACNLPFLPYLTAYEDYLLRLLSPAVNQLSEAYQNTHKNARESPQLTMQPVSTAVLRRNGCIYMPHKKAFRLRLHIQMPLINATWLNGKSGFKAVKAVLNQIGDEVENIEEQEFRTHVLLHSHQLEIRNLLREKQLDAFVANGSILPRKNGKNEPMENAKPFISPKELQITLQLSDGTKLTGMGLKRGITVITGGGYSGKSTLLDSLEMGIYNHKKGDGREYVITEDTACKIYAEDGRWVSHADISPFYSYIPGDIHDFSTPKASGSISQAVSIIETVYGGSRLLLIDEDTSATNFMIRDANMRKLVKREPIVPFTDRVEELKERGVSTVLVIGGSSEYLKYADRVLLMEDYELKDKTEEARRCLSLPDRQGDEEKGLESSGFMQPEEGMRKNAYRWTEEKYLQMEGSETKAIGARCVEMEPAGCIRLDAYTADIRKMTAVSSKEQINSLAYMLEKLITKTEQEEIDLKYWCEQAAAGLFAQTIGTVLPYTHKYELWLEAVRPVDLLMAACRLRRV